MHADVAKALSIQNLRGPVIEPYMALIFAKIKLAAENGKRSISHPFHGSRMTYPCHDTQQAIWSELTKLGYEVIHHPNPDPGHPASTEFDSINW